MSKQKYLSVTITLDKNEMAKLDICDQESAAREIHTMIAQNGTMKVPTPVGMIQATVMPDQEYPGICMELLKDDGSGTPGAILEWSPTEQCAILRVFGMENPDGDPVAVYPMSAAPEWNVTDPDSCQILRQIGEKMFELYQVQKISEEDRYAVAHDVIDLRDLSDSKIESILDCYGYESMQALIDEYGDDADSVLAECRFELDAGCLENLMPLMGNRDGYTWEEAREVIMKMSGFTGF